MSNWNDKDFIPERMLERLRLGELGDEETQRLLDELEARGEMHRLEALIEEDEEIRAHYPPAVMASHARERLRRRKREPADRPGKRRVSRRVLGMAALVMGLVFGAMAYLTLPPRSAQDAEIGAASPVDSSPSEPDESSSPMPDESSFPTEEPWRGMLEEFIARAGEGNSIPIYACAKGEVGTIKAADIRRVTTDASQIMTFENDEDELRMTCIGDGSGIANFHYEDEPRPRSITVRSAARYEDEIPRPPCSLDGPAEARVVLDRQGTPEQILVAGRISDSATQCLREHFEEAMWAPSGDRRPIWRVAIWSQSPD